VVDARTGGALAFGANGDVLFTAGSGPALTAWDGILWSDDLAAFKRRLCPIVGSELTASEWRKFLPGEPQRPTCKGF
jgi:hypothetical protein